MCDPITLTLLVGGTAASVVGGGIQAREAVKADAREANARNKVLQETLRRNETNAVANREAFKKRITESEPAPAAASLATAQDNATTAVQGNLASTATEAPIAGDAPQIIKGAMDKSLSDSFRKSMDNAKSMAQLTGYNAAGRDAAIADAGLGQTINTNNNFVRGNMSIMPYLQDYAAYRAYKPSSGFGQILQSLGSMATQAAGARGGAPKAPAPHVLYG